MTLHPIVSWAQRADVIYLTVEVTDITNPKIDLTADRFHFKGKGEKEQSEFECEIEFLKPIDVENSKQHLTPRSLNLVLAKTKDSEGYWDKLQKGGKLNFLKVDFNKWKDEDDEDDEVDPMAGGGGMPDMGSMAGMMGGAGGAGGMPNMADLMSSMGGGGAGGPGGMDFSELLKNMPKGGEGEGEDEEEGQEGKAAEEQK